MKVALAQINTTVGDFSGNLDKVRAGLERAREAGVDLVVFPEQTLPGYPAEDLLEREDFITAAEQAFAEAVTACRGIGMVIGTICRAPEGGGNRIHNSVALVDDGKVVGIQHKTLLPTYDVFDEARYFRSADEHRVFAFRGRRLGLAICEDVWNDPHFWSAQRYTVDPVEALCDRGADLIVTISASPFSIGRSRFRHEMLTAIARRCGLPIVYSNLVGGNTTLVFDGASMAIDAQGRLNALAPMFDEAFCIFDTDDPPLSDLPASLNVDDADEIVEEDVGAAYAALVLGVRDYLGKSGFSKAVLGLSGGIDSALTAAVAVDALGADNVLAVALPSRYSSDGSVTDSRELAANLGIDYRVIPIAEIFDASLKTLEPVFAGRAPDVTEENLQARIRGLLLMALSNKFGALLLTTGNKSELAVGYCTLYGDMSGGLAVISDVPKTLVYRLARWINRSQEIIPANTIEKPPSAELRPDQKDEDSLPPYEVLDPILQAYIEQHQSAAEIIAQGYDPATVRESIRLVDLNEYKRKQAAPGIRITSKAFGPGRRFPIVQKYGKGRNRF